MLVNWRASHLSGGLGFSTSARLVARVVRYDGVATAFVSRVTGRQIVRVLDVVHHSHRVQRLHRHFLVRLFVTGEIGLGHPIRAVRYGKYLPSTIVDDGRVGRDLGSALVAYRARLAVVGHVPLLVRYRDRLALQPRLLQYVAYLSGGGSRRFLKLDRSRFSKRIGGHGWDEPFEVRVGVTFHRGYCVSCAGRQFRCEVPHSIGGNGAA